MTTRRGTAPRTSPRRDHPQIQETARRHLADAGPAALSLRAIAREVGMVSSAVYRYFPSRDDLLTALIVEAYDELGAAVEAGRGRGADRGDLRARFGAVCPRDPRLGPRQPARVRPDLRLPRPRLRRPRHDSPRPPASRRVPRLAPGSQQPRTSRSATAPRSPAESAAPSAASGPRSTPRPRRRAHGAQADGAGARVFGHVSLELFGHMHRGVLDYDAHFAQVIDQLAADLGLTG